MTFSSIGKSIFLEVNFRPLCKVLCEIKHYTSAHSRVLINVQYVILSAMWWALWNYVINNGWKTLQWDIDANMRSCPNLPPVIIVLILMLVCKQSNCYLLQWSTFLS
jgi:hypothetical protein